MLLEGFDFFFFHILCSLILRLFSFHVGCNLGTLLKGTWIYIYIYILIGNKTFIQKIEHHVHDGEHSDQEKIQQVQKLNLI